MLFLTLFLGNNRKGYFMKKIISLLTLLALTFSFTGCMSEEEKMKAAEDEKLAAAIVEKYLDENYKGAEILKTRYLERNRSGAVAVPDFGVYATGYCVSDIDYGTEDFSVIVNTDTGECWDNYGYNQQKSVVMEKITTGISGADIDETEIRVFYKDFTSTLRADDCQGFLKKGDEIFSSDKYIINVLLKCDGNIARLDNSKLKEADCKAETSVAAISFTDIYSKASVSLDNTSFDLTLNKDYKELYRLLEEKIQFEYTYDLKKKEYVWNELPFVDYERMTLGGFTFCWNDYGVQSIDFRPVNAEKTYTEKSGTTYTSVSDTAVTVTYDIDTDAENRELFCWVDEEFEYNYLVLDSDGVRKDNIYKIGSSYKNYGDCREITMSKLYDDQPFTLGIYSKDK